MKKVVYLVTLFFVLSIMTVQAQNFKKGSSVINLGIGFGSSLDSYAGSSQSPAISGSYEQGVWEVGSGVVSLGAYAGVKSYSWNVSGSKYKWNYTIIGARSAYHFNIKNEKLDAYGGAMLSYNILNYSGPNSLYNTGSSGAGITLFAGGRYYFAPKLAVFAELGYGVSFLTAGISLKLK